MNGQLDLARASVFPVTQITHNTLHILAIFGCRRGANPMAAFAIKANGVPLTSIQIAFDMTADILARNDRKAVMPAGGVEAHEGHHPLAAAEILRDVGHRLPIRDYGLVTA